MTFNLIITGILLLLSHVISGLPSHDSPDIENKEIVGQATNIITTKLLKGNVENDNNSVFSPIGYASILAILGEGAQEETNNDINTVLKHPNDRTLTRSAYRSVLSHLQGKDPQSAPQFRSWFYIYKNNSIDDSFRQTLLNDFYVTVRNVEPYNSDQQQQTVEATTHQIIKTTKHIQPSIKMTEKLVTLYNKPTNSKDIVEFDSFKMEAGPVDQTRIDTQNDPSKFDEIIEDRQYVEVPLIKNEMEKTANVELKEKVETEKIPDEVKATNDASDAKNFFLPLKHYEEMEIMQAAETRLGKVFGGISGEGASIVSGSSIIGEKENLTEKDANRFEPKMLLFNGLYYHGNWAIPFQHLRDESFENVFNTMNGQKVSIKMMKAQGYFKTAKILKYNSEAVEFPYDNIRYSMLVIVPEGPDGLKQLINDFNANTLNEICKNLEDELITVHLPKFEVQTTGGAEKIFAKEGLASLFTSKANFSGISKTLKLRVDEIQQHVNLRVDETSSAENFLTASIALRSNAPVNERSMIINRPFLFFVRDHIDDVTIVAGKITTLQAFAMDEPEISQ